MNHIEPLFKRFLLTFDQNKMSPVSIEFSKVSFYAGAASMFAVLMEKIEAGPSNKDGGKFLFEVEQELLRYMDESVQVEVQTK